VEILFLLLFLSLVCSISLETSLDPCCRGFQTFNSFTHHSGPRLLLAAFPSDFHLPSFFLVHRGTNTLARLDFSIVKLVFIFGF
jgi:hypothetical protein